MRSRQLLTRRICRREACSFSKNTAAFVQTSCIKLSEHLRPLQNQTIQSNSPFNTITDACAWFKACIWPCMSFVLCSVSWTHSHSSLSHTGCAQVGRSKEAGDDHHVRLKLWGWWTEVSRQMHGQRSAAQQLRRPSSCSAGLFQWDLQLVLLAGTHGSVPSPS